MPKHKITKPNIILHYAFELQDNFPRIYKLSHNNQQPTYDPNDQSISQPENSS